MNLARKLPTRMRYGRRWLKLNLSYDVVLRIFELYKDELYQNDLSAIVDMSLRMLVKNYWVIKRRDFNEKSRILEFIYENFLGTGKGKSDKKFMDFKQDAGLIYASFKLDYEIDLFEEQGRLDWRVFVALLQGLSDKTKLREVIGIRGRVIPAPTKYNADEIRVLREAKAYYALHGEEQTFEEGLAQLAKMLEGTAKNG